MVADRDRADRAHADRRGGRELVGLILGVLFIAAGAGRIYVERQL